MRKANSSAFLLIVLALVFQLSCADDDAVPAVDFFTGNSATDAQENRYQVGFDQVSSINQNPFVRKVNSSGTQEWRVVYEDTPVDSRAVLIAIDAEDRPWVVFTVDGGSNNAGYITQKETAPGAFSGVWQNSYGRGGGPKVAILARLNPENGQIVKGTFLTARLNNGNTNTFNITKLGFTGGNVAFETSTAAWPPGVGSSYERMPDITDEDRTSGAFIVYYEMDSELSEIKRAQLVR